MIRLNELNVALVVRHRSLALDVRPAVDPRWPQHQADAPGSHNHAGRSVGGAPCPIRKRPRHAEVPIETDDQQVQHGRIGRQIVERQPKIANVRPERPVAQQRGVREQRHREHADGEISDGQREQEVVADRLQLFVDFERYHHHDVANDGDKADRRRKNGQRHHLAHSVPLLTNDRIGAGAVDHNVGGIFHQVAEQRLREDRKQRRGGGGGGCGGQQSLHIHCDGCCCPFFGCK